jgi:Dolichyl-phosphate-mannose-protein mannosyltransferase
VLLVGAVAVLCWRFGIWSSPAPFAYDESDYMYAGTQGFVANALDRGAISLPEYVSKGLELARDKTLRASMSQYVRSAGDISFYRHYHGPVYAYWITLWHALGVTSEASYRATGLILHAVGALAIFWLFLRVFPDLPASGAFIAALMFAMNRTTLTTAVTITQHIAFELLAILTLFAMALFLRTGNRRWWDATAALAAASFASVEISAVLIAAIVLTLILFRWKEGWKPLAALLGRGIAWFLVTVLVIWPAGILKLNALKGYAYLAYMAVIRKTFSPISAGQLWGFKLKTYPYEFILPLLALVIALAVFRKLKYRAETAPFLIYTCLFFAVTLKVTLPYTYYHGSLLASAAVVTGVLCGELWRRTGPWPRWAALAAVVGSLLWMDVSYYAEAKQDFSSPSATADVLAYLNRIPAEKLFVPFFYLPALHYYRPEIATVGYDTDWTVQRLADDSLAAAPMELMCLEQVCRQLEAVWPSGTALARELVSNADSSGEPMYAMPVQSR